MKMYITVIFVMVVAVHSSYQLTCTNKKTGKSACESAVCKKDLKCEGNVQKDPCQCCEVCLLKKHSHCSGYLYNNPVIHNYCDHGAPICAKIKGWSKPRCITVQKALIHDVKEVVRRSLTRCKKSKNYSTYNDKHLFQCYLKSKGPEYFCRKEKHLTFNIEEECCMHVNGCNPNPEIYVRVHKISEFIYKRPKKLMRR